MVRQGSSLNAGFNMDESILLSVVSQGKLQ